MASSRSFRRGVLFILIMVLVAGLVGCDHATKHLAAVRLEGRPALDVVAGVVDLQYHENRDASFNLLRSIAPSVRRPLLVATSLAAVPLLLVLWWQRRAAGWPVHLAFALLLAGDVGNLLDRALRGYVIDFVHVRYWPVFNVADAYLVVGAALLLLLQRRVARAAPAAGG